MARVLIIGLGYVGTELANQLNDHGHTVYAICRRAKKTAATLIQKDVFSLEPEDLPQVDFVFSMLSAGERSLAAYQRAYPQAIDHLAKVLNFEKIQRFFYVSSTRVYPSDDQHVFAEHDPLNTDDPYAQCLIAAEDKVQRLALPTSVVRFSGLYGPERTRLVEKLKQQHVFLSDKPLWTNRIHRTDAAGVLRFLMTLAQNEKEIWNASDDCPVEHNTLIRWLSAQLHVELSDKTQTLSRSSKKVGNTKLKEAGYSFRYPDYKSGYAELL